MGPHKDEGLVIGIEPDAHEGNLFYGFGTEERVEREVNVERGIGKDSASRCTRDNGIEVGWYYLT